jgi:hypothetical protein
VKLSIRSFVALASSLAIGCLGSAWGILALPQSEFSDDFRNIKDRLLSFETFRPATFAQILESKGAQDISPCDTHPQRAMLLMEMSLAESALRSGAVQEFDQRTKFIQTRATHVLSCTPRESFVWLLVFQLEVLNGHLDEQSFDLLAMSYETSPNEAWISIRRILVAMPLVLVAPESARQRILGEFQLLTKNGFVDAAARAYLGAPEPARSLLQSRLEQLNKDQQAAFSNALQKFRT